MYTYIHTYVYIYIHIHVYIYKGTGHLLGWFPILSSFPMTISAWWQQNRTKNIKNNNESSPTQQKT